MKIIEIGGNMDFKRKIALILLGGLILGLFSSYMLAMETAIITDFNGQTVQLNDAQRTALRGCETLKHMIEDTGIQEVPFEGVAPFITNQNFQHLAQLIKDKRYLNQVQQNQDCIELFKFADYMNAPTETLAILADRIYELLCKKIKDTVNEQEKADLEYFCEAVESNLSYYPDFSSLIKNRRDLEKLGTNPVRPSRFLLDFNKLGKKLRSLEGIEELVGHEWPKHKRLLGIGGHKIDRIDASQIKKAFPNLRLLFLQGNDLRHIANIHASNIQIDLRNNPIESITVDNPRSLKNTKIFIDKDARPVVTFNQSRFDKCAAWLEALRAQGSVAINRPGMLKYSLVIGGAACAATHLCNFIGWAIRQKKGDNVLLYDKGDLKAIICGAALITAIACGLKVLSERNQIRQELAQLAYDDGDHVSINFTEPYHHGDTRTVQTHSCPSKYAYNLFGKN